MFKGIDNLSFRLSEAAEITDVPQATVRAWVDRSNLFQEMVGVGKGHRVSFTLPKLLRLAAMDALRSTGLGIAASANCLNSAMTWPFHYGDGLLYASKTYGGETWAQAWRRGAEAVIVVDLVPIWQRIEPKLRQVIRNRVADGYLSEAEGTYIDGELDILNADAVDDHLALLAICRDTARTDAVRRAAVRHYSAMIAAKRRAGDPEVLSDDAEGDDESEGDA